MPRGPLSGYTVGLTAGPRVDEQKRLLVAQGADCLHGRIGGSEPDLEVAERLVRATVDRRVDAVTFTTPSEVEGFFGVVGERGVHDDVVEAFGDVSAVCTDQACATELIGAGVPSPLVPERPRLDDMVQLLADHFAELADEVVLAGSTVRVQGRLALVDGSTEAWLTDRERAIFDALIERPGVVLSKRDLLRRVWRGRESDEHVVEVTVARLRQRLGPAASGIETVVRRGYRVGES